jgi:DNA invertase Pin-like site-specific DNA recombinase
MRSFGTEISGNRRPKSELSPEARSAILYGPELRQSPSQLARNFEVNRSTIYDTKNRFLRHHTTVPRPRKGGPQKLSEATKR